MRFCIDFGVANRQIRRKKRIKSIIKQGFVSNLA